MFEKYSKHIKGFGRKLLNRHRHLSLALVGRCSSVVSARDWRSNSDRVVTASDPTHYPVGVSPLRSLYRCIGQVRLLHVYSFGWDIISCWSLLYGVHGGGSKPLDRNVDFLNETLFLIKTFKFYFLEFCLDWLFIYRTIWTFQDTLSVYKDMIVS